MRRTVVLAAVGGLLSMTVGWMTWRWWGVAAAGVGTGVTAVVDHRFGWVTRTSRWLGRGLAAVVLSVSQLVIVAGRRHTPTGGWQPTTPWEGPSRRLWTRAPASVFDRRRRSVAVSLVVTTVVVAAVDVAAGSVVHSRWADTAPVRSGDRFESSPTFSDRQEAARLQDDAATVEFVPAHPYAPVELWTLSSTATETLTFDPATGRRVPANVSAAASDQVVVAVIGASAAFGLGATDEESTANVLTRQLQQRGINAVTTNLAIPGYTVEQSVLDLRYRLEAGWRPEVVVLLSGFNDTFLALYHPDVPASMADRRFTNPQWSSAVSWWADRSLVSWVVGHRRPEDQAPLRRYRGAEHEFLRPEVAAATAVAVTSIRSGVEELWTLADRYGFVPVFAWTPSWVESSFEPEGSGGEVSATVVSRWREVFVAVHEALTVEFGDRMVSPTTGVYGHGCFFDLTHHVGGCSAAVSAPVAAAVATRLDGWVE